jgi:arsenite methyltransferase
MVPVVATVSNLKIRAALIYYIIDRLNNLIMSLVEINKRYSQLAESACCLSCGGAINHAEPKPGEICVDLGSGRGTDVLRMAESVGNEGFVYGIDISDGMLEKASLNAEKFGITNVKFISIQAGFF